MGLSDGRDWSGVDEFRAIWRKADIDASAGAVDEIARVIKQIRVAWPKVRVLLRANSGFMRDGLGRRNGSFPPHAASNGGL